MGKRIGEVLLSGLILGLCLAIFSGCGRDEESERVDYYDIVSKVDTLFEEVSSGEVKGMLLGMQYYFGEPVQLWSEGDEVYLVRTDGSREKLIAIPQAAAMCCYLDGDGSIYCWERYAELAENGIPSVWKYDASGQEVCRVRMEEGIVPEDICQLSDGKILLLLRDRAAGALTLAELDARKGAVSTLNRVQLGQGITLGSIASGDKGVLFLEQGFEEGFSEISLKDGKKGVFQSFKGSGYILGMHAEGMEIEDFRTGEDGSVEILWAEAGSGRGVLERLQMKKMDKTVLVMQDTYCKDPAWLKETLAQFNKNNEQYYVIYECPERDRQMEFGQGIAVQIAAGKGPDILMGDALSFVDDLAGKGGMVDLAPYMAESGMKEEDYFPSAFSYWRDEDKIYSVSICGTLSYQWLEGTALGMESRPEIEILLDALLAQKEDVSYMERQLASEVLLDLLEYSENCCGMLDWEKGLCDFRGELYAKMMLVANKYGDTWDNVMAGKADNYRKPVVVKLSVLDIYEYETLEEVEKQGGILLLNEDGAGYEAPGGMGGLFAINANSAHIEGAWEFISYMMSDQVQRTQRSPMRATSRAVCIAAVEEELRWLDRGNVEYRNDELYDSQGKLVYSRSRSWSREDITDEKAMEYISMRDKAVGGGSEEERRMKPVWQIIREESEAYFTGDKSIEEVADIITNRVQLYLDENQ